MKFKKIFKESWEQFIDFMKAMWLGIVIIPPLILIFGSIGLAIFYSWWFVFSIPVVGFLSILYVNFITETKIFSKLVKDIE